MPAPAPAPALAPAPVTQSTPPTAPVPAANADFSSMKGPIRIDAGASAAFTDPDGNVWLADQGFDGGDDTERASDLAVANTDNPGIYRTEHFGMNSFSCKLPNGRYMVKLHFAETYDDVTAAGGRVFSFNVNGQEFNNFDVFAKAGGGNRAYVESVVVNVTEGKLTITFTKNVQNPEINGIEIIPD